RPPRSPPFPYTTLFRSRDALLDRPAVRGVRRADERVAFLEQLMLQLQGVVQAVGSPFAGPCEIPAADDDQRSVPGGRHLESPFEIGRARLNSSHVKISY